jgi:indolepyruvate ferredoxin oxidoreductase beta subunit
MTWNFFLAGVGGQGTLLASTILAEVGVQGGYDVKKSEVHGMAQRGGAVSSHVRWGTDVRSPLLGAGEADILVAFERLEALRHLQMLRLGGKILINDYSIVPVTVTTGSATYPSPSEFADALGQLTDDVTYVPGVRIAQELGNAKANNIVMLGTLSCALPVQPTVWTQTIERLVPARFRELNLEAFARGRQLVAAR